MRGKFISFEGIEGTGKSTQAKLLYQYLTENGHDVILTEEPGGTEIGRKIREVLLSTEHREMTEITELLLYNASRAQHIKEIVLPLIERGAIVITDRFVDSTIAYQGYGRGIDMNLILSLDDITTSSMRPDITILLDIDTETGLKRNRGINKNDRIELEDIEFHKRVRNGYLDLAKKEPKRIRVIDVSESIGEVRVKVVQIITDFLTSQDEP